MTSSSSSSPDPLSTAHRAFLKACRAIQSPSSPSSPSSKSEHNNKGFIRFQERLTAELLSSDLSRIDGATFVRDTEALFNLGASLAKHPPKSLGKAHPSIRFLKAFSDKSYEGIKGFSFLLLHENMPFLASSLANHFARERLSVQRFITVVSSRDLFQGKVSDDPSLTREQRHDDLAAVLVQCHGDDSETRQKEIQANVERVCARNRAAVEDWQRMREAIDRHAQELQQNFASDLASDKHENPTLEKQEAIDLLQWVLDENMTFLGLARDLKQQAKSQAKGKEEGLGILDESRDSGFSPRELFTSTKVFDDFRASSESVVMLKAERHALVHRDVPLDVLLSKEISDGAIVVLVGLLTSKGAYASLESVPLLRRQLRAIGARLGVVARSQKARHVRNLLQLYPRSLLWQAPLDTLCHHIEDMREAQQRGNVKLLLLPTQGKLSAVVCMAKQNYGVGMERVFARILARKLQAHVETEGAMIGEDALARVHFRIACDALPSAKGASSIRAIEEALGKAARSAEERVSAALEATFPSERCPALLARYAKAFPAAYWEEEEASEEEEEQKGESKLLVEAQLAEDLQLCEECLARDDGIALSFRQQSGQAHALSLCVRGGLTLSDLVPILESLGFKTLTETPYHLSFANPKNGEKDGEENDAHEHATLYRVQLEARATPSHPEDLPVRFIACFQRIHKGLLPADSFNRLLLLCHLDWREVALLRALTRYLRQAAVPFSQQLIAAALARAPNIAESLVALFKARLDPALVEKSQNSKNAKNTQDLIARHNASIEEQLAEVASREDDRIVRLLRQTVAAIARSNYFQANDETSETLLSFKFFSDKLDFLPSPRPWREIFVSASDFEAVHLRFGPVARGGLRWSDRIHDFRTEILGLVKAQRVKNAVIVPVGAKGGFVIKSPAPDPKARQQQGISCYKRFIAAMLDISDNLHDGKSVPPPRTRRWDGDDTYLVVAADKGTATFSDIANGIAIEKGYWLGDAFASGGSVGYDHKQMGITSRGAWECVEAHFREARIDQQKPFAVIAIGDMGGDVFGNGMLYSEQSALIAAFNHKHIFFDPTPEVAKSHKERRRLFDNPARAGWDNYNAALISQGGGIFLRSAKTIPLSKEVRARFDIEEASLPPDALIKKILQARTDLLWFGGIGTFVKAERENNADIGDHANDSTRVSGAELRAKVIGEGANLGLTQAGRVEFALKGGRCNMDAIDNSAGVDCSDHEVNIKILLALAERAGTIDERQRQKILVSMTDDIARDVLSNNYRQSQALSLMESLGLRNIERQRLLIRDLVREAGLERKLEELPNEEEIDRRRDEKKALTRPELSVLLCYTKNALYEKVLESDLPDDARLFSLLRDYFPQKLRDEFLDDIRKHPLKREIIATRLTSLIVDHLGASFLAEVRRETGASTVDIARAAFVVMQLFSLHDLWNKIDALDDKIAAPRATRMRYETQRMLFRLSAWFLHRSIDLSSLDAVQQRFAAKIADLERLPQNLPSYFQNEFQERAAIFAPHEGDDTTEAARAEGLAGDLALLKLRSTFCDIALLAEKSKVKAQIAGRCYYAVSEKFGFDRLRTTLDRLQGSADPWQQRALANAIDDLWEMQGFFTEQALRTRRNIQDKSEDAKGGKKGDNSDVSEKVVEAWFVDNARAFERLMPLLQEARGSIRLPMVMVLMRTFHQTAAALSAS